MLNRLRSALLPLLFPLLLSAGLGGCATLVGEETQIVPIASTPPDAELLIEDETGKLVFKGKTPVSIKFQKSSGKYWGGKEYKLTLSKAGFKTQTVLLKSKANTYYLAGNLLLGGVPGWFVIDPWNGKMYDLDPEELNVRLLQALVSQAGDGAVDGAPALHFVLLEQLPLALHGALRPLN